MSDAKTKALELAVVHGGSPAEVVKRAEEYLKYLTAGPGAAKADAASKGEAAPPKGDTAPKGETAPKGDAKASTKATPAPGTKPAAPAKAGAAAPKGAAAAAPANPPGDTKDPKGNNTYDDVVAALQKVMQSVPKDPNDQKNEKGRAAAYAVLAEKGEGVKGVRDLKPALYDAVVAGCNEAVAKAKKAPPPKPAQVQSAAVDDFGQPIDTSGASVTTAGEDDPPEGGSGEDL